MKIRLDDNGKHLAFAPLTLTRPVGDLRIGILTNAERWQRFSSSIDVFYQTEAYLHDKFDGVENPDICVNAQLIPTKAQMQLIVDLKNNERLVQGDNWLAKKGDGSIDVELHEEIVFIEQRWNLFQYNEKALKNDFELLTAGKTSQQLSASNTIIGDVSSIFLEKGARVEAAILNASHGPIYIAANAEIMEGSIVRGPLAMLEHSALKLGTKVYGATTLGPHCKVGGEVNNVIFQSYSNKGHDGFLGNALIGEWCNLGADTNSSNLKNNYGNISVYSYETNGEVNTDTQFMGVCMGDHSKCGINTMFNTATVVGVSSNVFGAEFPAKYIPSFSWGGKEFVPFKFEKAIEYSNNMMARRGLQLTDAEIQILRHIADN